MGYRGKVEERHRARELRAESWTLAAIAAELNVSKSSVSTWVRDVDFVPRPRNRGHPAGAKHPMRLRKEAEIVRCRAEAELWVSTLSPRDLAIFALGLYAGEGDKGGSTVGMANTNPTYLRLFLAWFRAEFAPEEHRLRAKLYLHEGLDLDAATRYWSAVLDMPLDQFRQPYRAAVDPTRRLTKHEYGCATVLYSCTTTARRLLARVEAVASPFVYPG